MQSEIAVNEHLIISRNGHALIGVKHIIDFSKKTPIIDHIGQPLPDPIARRWPWGRRRRHPEPDGDDCAVSANCRTSAYRPRNMNPLMLQVPARAACFSLCRHLHKENVDLP